MVLDMATGLVSMGKIHDHANRGAPIPLGWALDENGDPTTDASRRQERRHRAVRRRQGLCAGHRL